LLKIVTLSKLTCSFEQRSKITALSGFPH